MDKIGYQIFLNLLVNDLKNKFEFCLGETVEIVEILQTAILFIVSPMVQELYFFSLNNIKNILQKRKKKRRKNYYQTNEDKLKVW